MERIILKVFMSIILASLLCGCGIGGVEGGIHNRTNDYLEAKPVAPLKIPASFKTQPISPLAIPKGATASEPVSFEPPGVFEDKQP